MLPPRSRGHHQQQVNGAGDDVDVLAPLASSWKHQHRQVDIACDIGSKACFKESGGRKKRHPLLLMVIAKAAGVMRPAGKEKGPLTRAGRRAGHMPHSCQRHLLGLVFKHLL